MFLLGKVIRSVALNILCIIEVKKKTELRKRMYKRTPLTTSAVAVVTCKDKV